MEENVKKIVYNSCFFSNRMTNQLRILITKWIVDDYSHVNKGDELFEYKVVDKNLVYTFKSPFSGYAKRIPPRSTLYSDNCYWPHDTILEFYQNEKSFLNDYSFKFVKSKDDFTKSIIINCSLVNSDGSLSEKGFCMSPLDDLNKILSIEKNISISGTIYFNFENFGGKYYLLLYYSKKNLKIDKLCSLHLLLDNGKVVTVTPESNPVNSVCRFPLSLADMNELESSKFMKWRISNGEGIVVKSGENVCCYQIGYEKNVAKKLSYGLFQKFIKEFRIEVRKWIPQEKVKIANSENINKSGACYVYLMNDTTNNFYKIGISNNPKYREHTLQSDKPTIELICAKEYPTRALAEAIESALHRAYASKRIRGEWFNLDASDVEDLLLTLK